MHTDGTGRAVSWCEPWCCVEKSTDSVSMHTGVLRVPIVLQHTVCLRGTCNETLMRIAPWRQNAST